MLTADQQFIRALVRWQNECKRRYRVLDEIIQKSSHGGELFEAQFSNAHARNEYEIIFTTLQRLIGQLRDPGFSHTTWLAQWGRFAYSRMQSRFQIINGKVPDMLQMTVDAPIDPYTRAQMFNCQRFLAITEEYVDVLADLTRAAQEDAARPEAL